MTQLGSYNYTVLGQGLCSSQDFFNYVTDGHTKLDEDFSVLKNIDDFLPFEETLDGLNKKLQNNQNVRTDKPQIISLKICPIKSC